MPVIIKEIAVKINVEEKPDEGAWQRNHQADLDTDRLIDACVDRVMEVLEQKNRR